MPCPTFDRNNKQHIIVLVVGIITILIILGVVIFCVVFFGFVQGKDGGGGKDNKTKGEGIEGRLLAIMDAEDEGDDDENDDADDVHDDEPPSLEEEKVLMETCDLSYQKWCLQEHNRLRARHSAAPLTMNPMLCKKALECAKHYLQIKNVDHSCPFKNVVAGGDDDYDIYGENLYMQRKKNMVNESLLHYTKRAMDGWYREWKWYDFKKGESKNGSGVGHLTQMLWLDSKELGVSALRGKQNKTVVVVCLYNPTGNIKGDYVDMVMPPKKLVKPKKPTD